MFSLLDAPIAMEEEGKGNETATAYEQPRTGVTPGLNDRSRFFVSQIALKVMKPNFKSMLAYIETNHANQINTQISIRQYKNKNTPETIIQ